MAYDYGGIKALKPKPNGGRKHREYDAGAGTSLLARFAKAAVPRALEYSRLESGL